MGGRDGGEEEHAYLQVYLSRKLNITHYLELQVLRDGGREGGGAWTGS